LQLSHRWHAGTAAATATVPTERNALADVGLCQHQNNQVSKARGKRCCEQRRERQRQRQQRRLRSNQPRKDHVITKPRSVAWGSHVGCSIQRALKRRSKPGRSPRNQIEEDKKKEENEIDMTEGKKKKKSRVQSKSETAVATRRSHNTKAHEQRPFFS
jgi:hypothetical protein